MQKPVGNVSISLNVRKYTFRHVRPAKNQISLRVRAVWSESSLHSFWIAKDAKFFMRTTKTYKTAQMRRFIWMFVGRTDQKVRFLTLGLNIFWDDRSSRSIEHTKDTKITKLTYFSKVLITEPQHEKTYLPSDVCAQLRHKSTCTAAQINQNLSWEFRSFVFWRCG